MHLKVVNKGKYKDGYIQIEDIDGIALMNLKRYFTKRRNNWFVLQQKNKRIPIDESFMNEHNIIPIGLWKEAVNFAEKSNIQVTFSPDFPESICDTSLEESTFTADIEYMFAGAYKGDDPFMPFDYQIKAAYQLAKYKKAVIEVSTSGGKTLISYILFKWLYEKGYIQNMILFVPNVTLVNQTLEAFKEYESYVANDMYKKPYTIETAGASSKYEAVEENKDEVPNLIIGTYQTITKFPKKWFQFQDCILGDEIQHITAKSVQRIYSNAKKAQYKYGVSGTVYKKNEFNYFLTQGFIGPLVYSLSSAQLINDEKRATPVLVMAHELRYDNIDLDMLGEFYNARLHKPPGDVTLSGVIYNKEKEYIRNSDKRFRYIIDEIKRTKKNALVLFSDIKGSYGKNIYETLLKETEKNIYYIDGSISDVSRKEYISNFEDDEDEQSIIVASIGVFSEGIDLKRLWNIYLVEPLKSEVILAQILGRGMRRFPGKKAVLLFDFQDNLDWPYGKKKDKGVLSYMSKHATERNKIYKGRKFPIKTDVIVL